MNERIKELAEQAGLIQWEISPWNPFVKIPDHESVVKAKKFAELLLKECVQILESREHPVIVNSIKEIKETFGV